MKRVWTDIDRMEKSELKDRRWVDARDLVSPVLAAGALLVLLALFTAATWAGGLP